MCFLVNYSVTNFFVNSLIIMWLWRFITRHVEFKYYSKNNFNHHGYTYLVVNNRQGFVEPATGDHANTFKGMWFHTKKHMLQGHGRTRRDSSQLFTALYEFYWQEIPRLVSRIFRRYLNILNNFIFWVIVC